MEFDNKLKPVKPFDYKGAGIKQFNDYKAFMKFYKSALKELDNSGSVPSDFEMMDDTYYDKYITKDPSGAFIVVDNTSGDLFTEEFDTEEEAQNYLMSNFGTGEDFKKE